MTHESGTLQPGGRIATRWFELRRYLFGDWKLHQAGTYSPDTDHRFMGSAAMDRKGNIAVAYSVSSSATFPSVRYAARKAGSARGQLGSELRAHHGHLAVCLGTHDEPHADGEQQAKRDQADDDEGHETKV